MGLEETLFPLTVDRTLFYGFFALLDLSAAQVVYFVFAAETIALVALVIVLLSTSIRVRSFVGSWFPHRSRQEERPTPLEPPKQLAEFANLVHKHINNGTCIILSHAHPMTRSLPCARPNCILPARIEN